MKVNYLLTAYMKLNSIWVKDLNVGQETIKILQERIGSNIFDFGHSSLLLDMSPEAREIKTKMNYWEFIKIKSLCTLKERNEKSKRQLME